MARVNITVPDELIARSREAGLNVSRVSAAALADELDRRMKADALRELLAELEAEQGPVSEAERTAASSWADAAFGPRTSR